MHSLLQFLRTAGRLKDTLRSAHTAKGRTESVAEHTWRLCLLAMTVQHLYTHLDFSKVLQLCIIHDLGEALHGDIPAVCQNETAPKSNEERRDLLTIIQDLPEYEQTRLLALWDDYENAASPEAKLVKGLDKLETIMQHNEGQNPLGFDYTFNLKYGQKFTTDDPHLKALRLLLDAETRAHEARNNA